MIDIFKYVLIIVSFVVFFGIKLYDPAYKDDNFVEEAIEKVIEFETGIDIDVTPMSPEDK